VILAAAYMLRTLQKVAYGSTSNPKHHDLTDLNFREIVTLTPLLVFVFWIGLHPQPFVHAMHASIVHVLQQAGQIAAIP
jgi:NADH-quinone oxidoreductase subunit M